jgi:hypothetical protein
VRHTAAAPQRMGIAQRDDVLTSLPNSPDALRIPSLRLWIILNEYNRTRSTRHSIWSRSHRSADSARRSFRD